MSTKSVSADVALQLWGAKKLREHLERQPHREYNLRARAYTEVSILSVDNVSVTFEHSEGYACCGGTDPDCYCSLAESPYTAIEIRANGYDKYNKMQPLYLSLEADQIDIVDMVTEMVELALDTELHEKVIVDDD